jgi:hypothetical protein
MKNLLLILTFITLFFTAGCSNITFNERYENVKWNMVIIAPFNGKNAEIAEEEFEHALAVSNQILVIPASVVLLKLKEHSLIEKYKADPTQAVIELAKAMKADGIIVAKVTSYSPKSKRAELATASASIYAKLIDVNDMSVVLSSQHQLSSVFSPTSSLLQDISKKAISEFQEGFSKLNGS